ncbi:DMT family transporter [Phocicoccus pinnipedialis]|uniref:Multidrug resistance protein YkkC n=1 Tax=Phocicoccus pinnipedialis TaxID=110845 RepID=A0A6V7R4F4_9BACL|nr:SMR family transporter [Jeotgalicoccus pinnipedialis]MBP1939685.1 paired small multidrug resistance pump [Jeotgalicoccus pinnipedialis]CAD2072307.1 Multidrug resistance protein YkkC [Jeotgalicoccus pinnipedialis]
MSNAWLKLLTASILEIGWVVGITHSDSIFDWSITIVALIICFYLLISSTLVLPVGSSYAIFVGLGATGVTLMDFLVFDLPFNIWKVIFIVILLVGVIGLKLVTDEEEEAA